MTKMIKMVVKIYIEDSNEEDSIEKIMVQINQLNKTVDGLQDAINLLNKDIGKLQTQICSKPAPNNNLITKRKSGDESKKGTLMDSDIFEPSNFNKKYWKHLKLDGDEIKYIADNNAKRTLPLSLYEIEVIREANEKTITKKDFQELVEIFPISNNTLAKVIYNIRSNPELIKLLSTLHNQIMNCRFNITDEGFIKIGKTITPIKKELANEWIFQCQNTNHLQKLIYNLQKVNSSIEKMQIKILCENYNNDKLLDLTVN